MSEQAGPNPFAFVVGCPRSGTTLLMRMLDSHRRLALVDEAHFIPSVITGAVAKSDPALTPALVERARNHRRFHRLGLSDEFVRDTANGTRTYSEFVSALYSEYGKARGKRLVGEKAPYYVRFLPVLHALFPRVRFVHIIRDGRDVALSLVNWAHRKNKGPVARYELARHEPVAACALWWAERTATGCRDGKRLGPAHYLAVRYEDLVARPEGELRRITEFLELPYAPAMLKFHEAKIRHKPGLSAKSAWLPPTPGLRDWRRDMAPRDVELFEALAGDLLTDLGYERGAPGIKPEIADLAERCRTWWRGEMARRPAKARRKRDSHAAAFRGEA